MPDNDHPFHDRDPTPPGDAPETQRWTFATDSNGDLRFNEMNTLTTTSGDRAIIQDLKVALGTEQGDDRLDEMFGLNTFVATQSVAHLEREIRRTLEYDDYRHSRVKQVTNVEIFTRPDRQAEAIATIEFDRGRTETLVFVVDDPRVFTR